MSDYIKKHGFHLAITVILTLILIISSYICVKVMTNEERIWTLEHQNPTLHARMSGLHLRFDDFQKSITCHIDLKFELLNEKIEKGAALAMVREAFDYANQLHATNPED